MASITPRSSLLRGSKNHVAQDVVLEVGGRKYRFGIREIPADKRAELEQWPVDTALKLGTEAEVLNDITRLAEWLQEHGSEPYSWDDGAQLTKLHAFELYLEQMWDLALAAALVEWTLEDPCTDEYKRLLPRVAKRQLYQVVMGGTSIGAGADTFFR